MTRYVEVYVYVRRTVEVKCEKRERKKEGRPNRNTLFLFLQIGIHSHILTTQKHKDSFNATDTIVKCIIVVFFWSGEYYLINTGRSRDITHASFLVYDLMQDPRMGATDDAGSNAVDGDADVVVVVVVVVDDVVVVEGPAVMAAGGARLRAICDLTRCPANW